MDRILNFAFGISLSYAIGTCIAGYYIVRWRTGRDLRELGSGTAGARNAARILGRGFGAVVFAWDCAKGALPALLAGHLLGDELLASACALAVVVGHVWPAQLGFRGGKGVATAAGALAVLQPALLAVVALAYALAALFTRDVSRRALAAFAAGALAIPLLIPQPGAAAGSAAILAILIWTHRAAWLSRSENLLKEERK
jgi:glycerol-3-phosphate acyltransferase PlsY